VLLRIHQRTQTRRIFPPPLPPTFSNRVSKGFQSVSKGFPKGFKAFQKGFKAFQKGFQRVSKGFQSISKGSQSVSKINGFHRVSKGFQSIFEGFPKGSKPSETGFPKGFRATSNPLENAFVDVFSCFRMEGHIGAHRVAVFHPQQNLIFSAVLCPGATSWMRGNAGGQFFDRRWFCCRYFEV